MLEARSTDKVYPTTTVHLCHYMKLDLYKTEGKEARLS